MFIELRRCYLFAILECPTYVHYNAFFIIIYFVIILYSIIIIGA